MSLYTLETGGELRPGISQEWLLTNGTGAFSSSTVVGCNTRRYHGLLCAALAPPLGRIIALSRIGEILLIDDSQIRHELSVNQFPGSFHPRGERYLRRFELDQIAQWHYHVEAATVTKQVMLLMGRNVVAVRYVVDPGAHRHIRLSLLPFLAMRDFHSLRRGTEGRFDLSGRGEELSIRHNDLTLHLRCDSAQFIEAPDWWRGHFYAIEAERGLDHLEDLFLPGRFECTITSPTTLTLIASTEPVQHLDWDAERRRREARCGDPGSIVLRKLHRAAADFIVARKSPDGSIGSSILAGYPWFGDWGRDTMISLPGLLLCTGRHREAAQVLSLFATYVSEGMIPNRFDDYTNQPSYNTVDASLWFIHACFEYLKASNDTATFEQKLLGACREIVRGYMRGTRYHIRMDEDGLITQGDPTTQLTWMDAKCNNVVFTPRHGKAVEINALWYHVLRLLKEDDLAERVKRSFAATFWISPFRGLCDVVHDRRRDTRIRPNQIFAVSLPNSPLNPDQQSAVVEVVRRELLTPYGLRTLAPGDPQFRARYTGDQFHRDAAYHNGTIWPWLIGPFLEAYLRVHQRSPEAIQQARTWLGPLLSAMDTHGCIGQISEIYEAEPPHRPVGCFAQAWSVAEVLRLATELKL